MIMSCVAKRDSLEFLNNLEINVYDGENNINLMDLVPLIKKGRCGPDAMQLLTRIVRWINSISKSQQDKDLTSNTNINLVFTLENKRITKQTIYQQSTETEILRTILRHKDKLLSDDFYSVITEISEGCHYQFVDHLRKHPLSNKFLFSIIFDTNLEVLDKLEFFDPRCNNYKSYFLAKNRGNVGIIYMVEDNIVLRTLLHLEILRKFIDYEDLVKSIYKLMVELL